MTRRNYELPAEFFDVADCFVTVGSELPKDLEPVYRAAAGGEDSVS